MIREPLSWSHDGYGMEMNDVYSSYDNGFNNLRTKYALATIIDVFPSIRVQYEDGSTRFLYNNDAPPISTKSSVLSNAGFIFNWLERVLKYYGLAMVMYGIVVYMAIVIIGSYIWDSKNPKYIVVLERLNIIQTITQGFMTLVWVPILSPVSRHWLQRHHIGWNVLKRVCYVSFYLCLSSLIAIAINVAQLTSDEWNFLIHHQPFLYSLVVIEMFGMLFGMPQFIAYLVRSIFGFLCCEGKKGSNGSGNGNDKNSSGAKKKNDDLKQSIRKNNQLQLEKALSLTNLGDEISTIKKTKDGSYSGAAMVLSTKQQIIKKNKQAIKNRKKLDKKNEQLRLEEFNKREKQRKKIEKKAKKDAKKQEKIKRKQEKRQRKNSKNDKKDDDADINDNDINDENEDEDGRKVIDADSHQGSETLALKLGGMDRISHEMYDKYNVQTLLVSNDVNDGLMGVSTKNQKMVAVQMGYGPTSALTHEISSQVLLMKNSQFSICGLIEWIVLFIIFFILPLEVYIGFDCFGGSWFKVCGDLQ